MVPLELPFAKRSYCDDAANQLSDRRVTIVCKFLGLQRWLYKERPTEDDTR